MACLTSSAEAQGLISRSISADISQIYGRCSAPRKIASRHRARCVCSSRSEETLPRLPQWNGITSEVPASRAFFNKIGANASADTVGRIVGCPAPERTSTGRLLLPRHADAVASRSSLDLSGRLFSVNRRKTAIWKESWTGRIPNEVGRAATAALRRRFYCEATAATQPIWRGAPADCALCAAR